MAITSLQRYATEAAASLPSMVILRRLPDMGSSRRPGGKSVPAVVQHRKEPLEERNHPAGCPPAGWGPPSPTPLSPVPSLPTTPTLTSPALLSRPLPPHHT